MSTLYPPYLEGKLPAQYGDTLRIPFEHNRAIGQDDFDGIVIQVKNIYTNASVYTNKVNTKTTLAIFNEGVGDTFTIGQYYKAQLAYCKGEEVGNYSTVGVFKYTAEPTVTIDELNEKDASTVKTAREKYTGCYVNSDDPSEKVYSYRFDIYDDNGRLFETSGDLIHNSANNTQANASTDVFAPTRELKNFKLYTIKYTVRTINDLIISSPSYSISKVLEVPFDYPGMSLNVVANNDDAYNLITITGLTAGYYRLRRSAEEDRWVDLCQIVEAGDAAVWEYKDFTIEQGVSYTYILQKFDPTNNIYAKPLSSEPAEVINEFEDAFLYDGKRQLKIRFNPKVSSFKTTLLESKTDTIGGKFPFFFRNGNVGYKEFPISGMVSLLMDDNHLFLPEYAESEVSNYIRTNLTSDNVYNERQFKLEVLNWLNNGKPKLFRSATEGSYIIRLMNVSLSPNDTLGRMLHTFNSTAYEVFEMNEENLRSLGFFHEEDAIRKTAQVQYWTGKGDFQREFLATDKLINFIVRGTVGATVEVMYSNKEEPVYYTTGFTGYYSLHIEEDLHIEWIKVVSDKDESYGIEYTMISTPAVENSSINGITSYSLVPQFEVLEGENDVENQPYTIYIRLSRINLNAVDEEDNNSYVVDNEEYYLASRIIYTAEDFVDSEFIPFNIEHIGSNIRLERMYYEEVIEPNELQ